MPILKRSSCGIPLKIGSIVIGVFYFVSGILKSGYIVSTLYYTSEDDDLSAWVTVHETDLLVTLCSCFMEAFLAVFLIVGTAMGNSALLLSMIVGEFLNSILLTIQTVKLICSRFDGILLIIVKIALITLLIVVWVLIVYFLLVVISYCQTLCKRRRANREGGQG